MTYLIFHYWGWMLVAAGVGLLGAMLSHHGQDPDRRPIWFFVALALLALGGVADYMHLLNGRPALWLETAALFFGAFVVGSQVGAPGRIRGFMWGPFLVAALVWACSSALMLGPTETALKGAAASAAGGNALDIGIDGRDALIAASAGDAAKRGTMSDHILQVDGIRMTSEMAEISGAADAKATADKAAADQAATDKAAADKAVADKAAADKAAADKAATDQAAADKAAADKASADKAAADKTGVDASEASLTAAKATAVAAAKALPETGPLAAAQCQTALTGLAAGENVKFETGSAKVSDDSKSLVAKIDAVLARCPETRIEVAGHTDLVGDAARNKALSQRRAEAVAELLKSGGANAARLTAVGYGQEKPVASNATPEGRAENRRIEFLVQ